MELRAWGPPVCMLDQLSPVARLVLLPAARHFQCLMSAFTCKLWHHWWNDVELSVHDKTSCPPEAKRMYELAEAHHRPISGLIAFDGLHADTMLSDALTHHRSSSDVQRTDGYCQQQVRIRRRLSAALSELCNLNLPNSFLTGFGI